MSKLRSYAPMRRVSAKAQAAAPDFRKVYKRVDQRSDGRCEVNLLPTVSTRCTHRATDHHHLYKPRRSNHEAALIVHLCRHHHDRCEWPYKRGRLVISLVNGRQTFALVFAKDKFALRSVLAGLLLSLASVAHAAEPKNPSEPIPQPADDTGRHWTVKRFYTQHDLQSLRRFRIPIDRLDYLEAGQGADGGSAGSGGPGTGGTTPGTVESLR